MDIIDVKPEMANFKTTREASAWSGGTTNYLNHSLYRSHDYYRGGKTASTDVEKTDIFPIIEVRDIKPNMTKNVDVIPNIHSVEEI